MRQIYALVVGIDEYPEKPLNGCVNDAHAWKEYLEEWAGREGRLHLEMLVNGGATREAILSTFRAHLGQAGEGDTALFCFSGHGSEERAPLPWAKEEPGGVSETLLAVDSRVEGGLDLADKELAVLIAEVARGGAHVAVVLDSCHSGTATRDPEEEASVRRMSPAKTWQRPEGTYWFEGDASVPSDLDSAGGWRVLPVGRHVLLAACEDWQVAREYIVGGKTRGLFTWCLLGALGRLGAELSYKELFKQVQTRVSGIVPSQTPAADGDLTGRLFDGAVTARVARYHVRGDREGVWWLDAGAVHGIGEGAELALLPVGAEGEEDLSDRLGTVRVVSVEAGRSRVEPVEGEMDEGAIYGAVLTQLPVEALAVALEGSIEELGAVRDGIERSPYLRVAGDGVPAGLLARLDESGWWLRRSGGVGDQVGSPVAGREEVGALVDALELAARWRSVAEMENPGSALKGAIEMTVYERLGPEGEPVLREVSGGGEVRLEYRVSEDGRREPPRLAVHLVNRSEEALYYALVGLDETFAVRLLADGVGRLAAGAEVWVGRSRGIRGSVPEGLHRRGVTRRRDLLMLLVSAVETDFTLLEQSGLGGAGRLRDGRRPPEARPGHLDTLLRRVAWREIEDEPPTVAHQWAVRRQGVVTVRPMAWMELPEAGGRVELVGGSEGVAMMAPAGLGGAVRLQPREALAGASAAAALGLEMDGLREAVVAGGLASDPGLSVLEVRGVASGRVSGERPLELATGGALASGERLAAVGWVGGEARVLSEEAGAGRCRVVALPSPTGGDESASSWLELVVLGGGQ